MKKTWMTVGAAALMSMAVIAEDAAGLKTQKEKVSYSIGVDVGRTLKRQQIELDTDALTKGMKDAMGGGKLAMTDEQMRATMMDLRDEMQEKHSRAAAAKGAENRKEGDVFLAKKKTEKDVVVLPSGLLYRILTAGKGKKPDAGDTVECHYKGTLIDGTEFDSSYRRGEPATFQVGQVIKGWQQALQLMPVGSKWQLFIPSDLAYGPRGAGEDIGPNATLIFEVELISIK